MQLYVFFSAHSKVTKKVSTKKNADVGMPAPPDSSSSESSYEDVEVEEPEPETKPLEPTAKEGKGCGQKRACGPG